MLTNSTPILDPFILPEIKHISKIKKCDILNSAISSKAEISDSVSHTWHLLWYIENIQMWTEIVISPYLK